MSDPEESHLVQERRQKVDRLRDRGVEPYPWSFPDRVPSTTVVDRCRSLTPGATASGPDARVAGRIRTIRQHGRSAFLDLEDQAGGLQLFLRVDELEEPAYSEWLADLDPGDIVGAEGSPMVTRRGEPSLLVRQLTMLAKAIAPPPEKFHGLRDAELRIRRRYLDLLSSPETRARFRARSLLVREIRHFFDEHDFLEVETPILGAVASGAAAEPFGTRSTYLDEDLQLRISLELPLKRLLVGGMERVYELGRIFRNEDLDVTHSPEFSMLEAYWAYTDYTDMRRLMEAMYLRLARRIADLLPEVPAAVEAPTLFQSPFAVVDFVEALEERSGIPGLLDKGRDELRALARTAGATVPDASPPGKFLDKLFEHYVEPSLTRPTFVVDHPLSTTPLAKHHRSKPGRVERFELYCRGVELANAYSELNDPDEQARRFEEQLAAKGTDHYAIDRDFIEALQYGMPPASGVGFGIDRAFMALTGAASIKEVILFPPVRSRP
ncbi:MAG: lysine--tRNA ligase [Thermoplasmata archaeon]|nr:lysine--tRNA ligase [Thermoplasmata archaeon]